MTAASIVAGLSSTTARDAQASVHPEEDAQASGPSEESDESDPREEAKTARAEARAAAKALRAETKAASRAERAEAKAAARAARAETKAARGEVGSAEDATQLEAPQDEDSTAADDPREVKAKAKAARDEERAKARLDRQAAALARRASRSKAHAMKSAPAVLTTEPDIDVGDIAERPIAVAAQLQRQEEANVQRELDRVAAKEQAAQTKREADEARQAAKAEAAAAKEAANAARQQEREQQAAAKAKADAANEKEREAAATVKAQAKRERDEAKAEAKRKREGAKAKSGQEATQGAAGHRADSVVEAPRAPKKSLLERLRRTPADSSGNESTRSGALAMLAVGLGALGFVFSVVLAIGAFMVALNPQDDGSLFKLVSNICDALVGPLRGVFSFSGVNGESKDALVAWGLGALGYLIVGLFAQSFLRDRAEED